MRLLITGGDSSLARYCVPRLLQDPALGPQWTIRLQDTRFADPPPAAAEVVTGDLRDPAVAAAAVADMTHVLHLTPLTLPATSELSEVDLLDSVIRSTYVLVNAAREAGVDRLILASTLDLFEWLPAHWHVNEVWRPRPQPRLNQLCAWLAELSVREAIRVSQIQAVCLRFGRIVDEATIRSQPFDPRWLHIEDATHGIVRALTFDTAQMRGAMRPDWFVFHIAAPGPRSKIRLCYPRGSEQHAGSAQPPFLYQPKHDFQAYWPTTEEIPPADRRPWREVLAPPEPVRSRPIQKVVIFGAGGPMGAATAREMASGYTLRLADIRPIAEIVARGERRPLPPLLDPPHENVVVDLRDPQQVMQACAGMDAVINTSVLRGDPVDAFLVNVIGAYNIARAAVAHGIRRVVQTGPFQQMDPGVGSYVWDYDVPVEAPARPMAYLYHHTKYLGQEVLRVFAEYHDLEVPVMLFWRLKEPEDVSEVPPFVVSWRDSGLALRRAVEVPALPSPYETFNVSVDLPHRRFDHEKIRTVLGWVPRDPLEPFWHD